MKYSFLMGAVALFGLQACQPTVDGSSPATSMQAQNVGSAIEARQADFDGVHHAALESPEFYAAVCNMTSESQVRSYYASKGFNMSSDGTGATAIAALKDEPFVGRMPSKAAALLRGCRGGHS